MANSINATTPQLKVVKNLAEAYLTLDLKNVEPLLSKDFQFQTFPKIAEHPDQAKGAHSEVQGQLSSLLTKIEITYHDVIEAPGKVVLHISAVFSTVDGANLDYDSLIILTLVEEGGALKVAKFQDFSDPEKRGNVHIWVAKALATRAL